jgi:hypothetical protein
MWIPKSGIHNRLEFLRNSTGSWKSLRDFHSSHRACEWALSYLTVSFRAQPQDVGVPTRNPEAPNIVLIASILISVTAALLDSVHSIRNSYGTILLFTEWFFTILFTIEYVQSQAPRLAC